MKDKTTYSIKNIEYKKDDAQALYDFAMQYKTRLIRKNKTKLKSLLQLDDMYKEMNLRADKLLKNIPDRLTEGFVAESKKLFSRYYRNYKHFNLKTNRKYRDMALENKLDRLMYYSAVLEAYLYSLMICEKLESDDMPLKSVLKYHDRQYLSEYFSGTLMSLINKNQVIGMLGIISQAIDTPLTDSFPEARKMHRMFYIHVGKTNSGKTYSSIQKLLNAETGIYLAPLRLLALEKYDEINAAGVLCSFSTGEEEKIIPGARHISATVEMADFRNEYDVAVIDECQMITDKNRGYAWTKAILGIRAYEICICTAPEALDLLIKVIEGCGDYYKIIHHRRNTPLVMEEEPFSFNDVRSGDALVAFSKARVNAIASQLTQKNVNVSVLYGALPYEARIKQFESFIKGESDVMVCTDAIGMGLNLPIKRIVFMETYKFDGISRRPLTISEIKQIAGRAGRRGIFDTGYVNAYTAAENEYVAKALEKTTPQMEAICISFPKQILQREDVELMPALKAWRLLKVQESYVKEDLEEVITAIHSIYRVMEKHGFEADKAEIYDMAALPLDRNDMGVMTLWRKYVYQRLNGEDCLEKPRLRSDRVEDLLSFFKKLDAYFICSRAWDMPYDAEWAEAERSACAALINEKLINDLENHVKTCALCGIKLEWNNVGAYCALCKYKADRAGKKYKFGRGTR